MPISIGDAVLTIGADFSKMDKDLKGVGQKMQKVGKNLTLKLTAPLAAFGALSIKTAADFSRAMAKVNAVTGATEDQFSELNATAKELGRTTQFTATQVADAMSFMGMAGMDADQILASIGDTLNLAAAGALDMASAADIVTNIMAGFNLETSELTNTVDVLAKAFTSSNTDLVQLGNAMKFAGPVAEGFGLTFEETAAIVGTFSNAGIQATLAGTSLRGAIVQLNNKAAEFGITMFDSAGKMIPMADILEQLEQKGFTAGEMMDLFGLRAGPAMTALLAGGSQALRDFTAELENAGGTAQAIADTQMEGLHGTLTRLKSAFEGLQLTVVEEIGPMFETLITLLTKAFRWFSDLPGPVKGFAVALGVLAAVIGPLLWFTGSLLTSLIGIKAALIGATAATVKHTVAVRASTIAMAIAGTTAKTLGVAIATTTTIILALVAGIGAIWWAVNKLISQRREQAEFNRALAESELQLTENLADYQRRVELVTLAEQEYTKALEGLDNEYAQALVNLKDAGITLNAQQEAFIRVSAAAAAAGLSIEAFAAQELAAAEASRIATVAAQQRLSVLQSIAGIFAGQTPAEGAGLYYGPGGLREQLIGQGIIPSAPFVDPLEEAIGVPGAARGMPILQPTLLSNLATGRPFAIAGERGPEDIVPRGAGGFRTADIRFILDGQTLIEILGQPLVDRIRITQALSF